MATGMAGVIQEAVLATVGATSEAVRVQTQGPLEVPQTPPSEAETSMRPPWDNVYVDEGEAEDPDPSERWFPTPSDLPGSARFAVVPAGFNPLNGIGGNVPPDMSGEVFGVEEMDGHE